MKSSRSVISAASRKLVGIAAYATLLLALTLVPAQFTAAQSEAASAVAQSEAANAAGVRAGGAVSTDDRVSTDSSPQLNFQEYRLELLADARPTDSTRFHAEAWLRSAGLSASVVSTADLFSTGGVAPVVLDVREAFFELSGFIFDNVDVKIGRQRIAWGTADKLNPTDNVNALDMSDPWDFGRHLGSDGVQLTLWAGGLQVTGIAVALFTPSVLPTGQWASALMPSAVQAPPGMTLGALTTNVSLPGATLADGISAGLRAKGSLFGYDLSLSYLYGRQSLPIINSLVITASGPTVANVNVGLVYPREHVFGADLAGSLLGVGIWAEAAVFLPDRVTLTTDASALGGGVTESTVLANSPYLKYVAGADYTFPGNVYLNVQFVHGLFHEAGEANLEDYFSIGLDWRLLDDKLKLSPLGLLLEVKDWNDVANNYAILAAPSLTIYPADGAELVVGFHWIQASSSTTFGVLSGKNEVFAHARYSF